MLESFKKFYKVQGQFYFKIWALHLLMFLSLVFLDFNYFVISLILYAFIVMPLYQAIVHEYICHEYVKPKNDVLDFLFLLWYYCYSGSSVRAKRDFHVTHHRHWRNPDMDPTQQKLRAAPLWRYVFSFMKPVPQHIERVNNALLENNKFVRMLEPHGDRLYWIFRLFLLIALPLPWFVIVVVYWPWLLMTLFSFHDALFHKYNSPDRLLYVPIYGNATWHNRHHEQYAYDYYGPGLWPYFNPSWYVKVLFFKSTERGLT